MFWSDMATNDESSPNVTPTAKPVGPPVPGKRHRGRRGGRGRARGPGRPRPAGLPADAPPSRAVETAVDVAPAASLAEAVAPLPPAERRPQGSVIAKAIEEVTQITESLKQVLDQMEEVLELVELAERQQIGDERELESLRRALHQLQGPRGGIQRTRPPGPQHHSDRGPGHRDDAAEREL